MRTRAGRLSIVLLALGMAAVSSSAAYASFPGRNGRLAFLALDGHRRDAIFTAFPDRSSLRRIHVGGADPSWSASGRRIVFRDSNGLGVMRGDGRAYRHLDLPRALSADRPTWSPDGRLIAFTGYTVDLASPESEITDVAVWVIRPDGRGLRRLREGANPSWSAHGGRIAFDAGPRGGAFTDTRCHGIWVMRPDGSSARQLTGRNSRQCHAYGDGGTTPDFSPDGRRVVYTRSTRRVGNASERNAEVFIVGVDGRGDRRVTRTARADEAFPVFSPDGTRIAFGSYSARRGQEGFFIARLDGSHRRLFRTDIRSASWQPLRVSARPRFTG